MSAAVFWPPLSVLLMLVGVLMFGILRWGDRLCGARTAPRLQNYEIAAQAEAGHYSATEEEKTSYNELLVEQHDVGGFTGGYDHAEVVEMGEVKEAAV